MIRSKFDYLPNVASTSPFVWMETELDASMSRIQAAHLAKFPLT